ncbi:hypothetical protein OAL44_02195 [Planctomycetaceae bacterium]|nr:hypothetical protein [Planctomycetaceae bacterium]MDC0307925.1 hypothetical protein [Planctomycetaceae bacterium]
MRTHTLRSSALLLCAVFWFTGCGDDSSEQATDQSQNTPGAPSTPEADYESEMASENYDSAGGSGMNPEGNNASSPAAPPRPPRPEDPTVWSSQEITSAVEERDLKVKDALKSYTESHRGEDQAAEEIVAWMEILKLPPVEPPKPQTKNGAGSNGYPGESAEGSAEGYPPGEGAYPEGSIDPGAYEPPMMEEEMYANPGANGQPNSNSNKSKKSDDEIAESLIDSLMGIQSLTSFQAARNLLEGKLTLSIEPEKTARQIMTALLQNIQGASDPGAKILRQTILEPELIRSGEGDFDSRRLQNISMEEHWKNAISVMDGMMGVDTSKAGPPKPQPGQGDYGYPTGSPEMSGGEIGPDGQPMKKDEGNQPPARNPLPQNIRLPNYTQEQATAAQNYLWAPEMIDQIAQRLTISDTLMREPDLVMLAGQLPATASRHAFQQFLEKNWKVSDDWTRNPVDLVKHDAFKKFMRDPGLLISLKSLPHEQANTAGANDGDYGGGEGGAGETGGRREAAGDPRERHSKGEWFKATEHMMLGLMDRMQIAASTGSLPASDEKQLDVRLHRKAEITIGSHLELVLGHQSADPKKPQPDKTTVNYVRIELNSLTAAEGEAIVKHYRSALRNENVFTVLNKNGMWMESSGTNRGSDELYSQDVLLTRNNSRKSIEEPGRQPANSFESSAPTDGFSDPGSYDGGGGGGGFVVEILTVRIPDPEVFLKPAKSPAVSQN